MRPIAFFLSFLFSAMAFSASSADPVGYWQSSDKNGKVSTIIRIYRSTQNTLAARLIVHYPNRNARCTACAGKLKNRPYRGLQLIGALKINKEKNTWSGGTLLDPEKGTFSKVKIRIFPDGRHLKIIAYNSLAWFGESTTWTRRK